MPWFGTDEDRVAFLNSHRPEGLVEDDNFAAHTEPIPVIDFE